MKTWKENGVLHETTYCCFQNATNKMFLLYHKAIVTTARVRIWGTDLIIRIEPTGSKLAHSQWKDLHVINGFYLEALWWAQYVNCLTAERMGEIGFLKTNTDRSQLFLPTTVVYYICSQAGRRGEHTKLNCLSKKMTRTWNLFFDSSRE